MLRCRCKRKAIEHEPVRPYKSTKPPLNGVVCTGFDSPWICNCGCPWSCHTQRFEEMQISARIINQDFPLEMITEGVGMEVLDAGVKRGGVQEFMRGEEILEDSQKISAHGDNVTRLNKIAEDGTIAVTAATTTTTTTPPDVIDQHGSALGFEKSRPRVRNNFNSSSNEMKENVLKKLNQKIKKMNVE